jgi:hypothetical protein
VQLIKLTACGVSSCSTITLVLSKSSEATTPSGSTGCRSRRARQTKPCVTTTNVPFTPGHEKLGVESSATGRGSPKPPRSEDSATRRSGLPNSGVKLLRQAGIDHSGYGGKLLDGIAFFDCRTYL